MCTLQHVSCCVHCPQCPVPPMICCAQCVSWLCTELHEHWTVYRSLCFMHCINICIVHFVFQVEQCRVLHASTTCAPTGVEENTPQFRQAADPTATSLPLIFVCLFGKDDKVPAPTAPRRAHQVGKLPWLRLQPPCRKGAPGWENLFSWWPFSSLGNNGWNEQWH